MVAETLNTWILNTEFTQEAFRRSIISPSSNVIYLTSPHPDANMLCHATFHGLPAQEASALVESLNQLWMDDVWILWLF